MVFVYCKDHKSDAEFLNKPLEHYAEMVTIFENSMATGKYAKGSSDAIGTDDVETDNDENDGTAAPTAPSPLDDNGGSSSATRPNKRAKIAHENEEEGGLIGAFKSSSERIALAIEKTSPDWLPPDLLDHVQEIPGFDETHKALYFSHLVENPRMCRAFPGLPLTYKISLLASFDAANCPRGS